jgi:hypothetical protein
MKLAPVFVLLLQPGVVFLCRAAPAELGCACRFDGNDSEDCVVWGTLDRELKSWPLADQDCLDAYDISVNAADPSIVCSSATAFVNALKTLELSPATVKFGLGIPYGGFWEESPSSPDIPLLKDSITIDGITYDCEASESDCYNAMKPYFESDEEGIKEMEDVCEQLVNVQRNARELEQSTLRVRLCQEDRTGQTILSECSTMFDAMEPDLQAFSTMSCGGFGTGVGSQVLSECDGTTLKATSTAQSSVRQQLLALSVVVIAATTSFFHL